MQASGHARWFERLLTDLQFELWIGDAAAVRTKRLRMQKTDRQDAQSLLPLLMKNRFPRIWIPDAANRDLRRLVWHRHRLVQMCTRIKNLGRWGIPRQVLARLVPTSSEIMRWHRLAKSLTCNRTGKHQEHTKQD
jgi:transposase